jgi:hypothetical protein
MLGCLLKEMEQMMDAKDIKINNTNALGNFKSADTLERYVQQIAQSLTEIINTGGGGGGDGRNVQVGATTMLAAGVNATVTESPLSTPTTLIIDFGIPQGIQGLKGDTGDTGDTGAQGIQGIQGLKGDAGTNAVNPIFTIGTVTLGETASVTVTGTYPNLVLNFVLVKGDKGDTGLTGEQGIQGIQGIQGVAGNPLDAPDGSILRAKLETSVQDEIKYDQLVASWTGSQTINNNVSFNLLSLLTPASITRNTIGAIFNNTTKVFTFSPRNFDQNIRAVARLTGTISGASGTAREFFVELTRPGAAGALLVRDGIVRVSDNNINSRQAVLDTYVTAGTTDPFFIEGFEIKLNNISTQTITITALTVLFFG